MVFFDPYEREAECFAEKEINSVPVIFMSQILNSVIDCAYNFYYYSTIIYFMIIFQQFLSIDHTGTELPSNRKIKIYIYEMYCLLTLFTFTKT